ncbi:MAG: L,D-transpeptidase family protein [Alphaproteobacteria bacterium]|nr:L,D-transpeptidase family protein [Alphaproteobacteria bacterium]
MALKALSLIYVMSASAFCVAIAMNSSQPWARTFQTAAKVAVPEIRSAALSAGRKFRVAAAVVNREAVVPAWAWMLEKNRELLARVNAPKPEIARAVPKKTTPLAVAKAPAPRAVAPKTLPALRGTIAPSLPDMQLADQEAELPLAPAPDANPPSPGELSRVLQHMKVSLTKELYENFELFLYVSKADHGPWAQRMYVFQKRSSGDLAMLYSFPVSTGAEIPKLGPSGTMQNTNTPPGYYQLDPDRMYRRYHSQEWDQPMPYAMFFSWEHDGLQTGLAIHAATGTDIGDLGKRASAGCVRLDPRNAQLLFQLIKKSYKGLAPRFAYDNRTATMANDGLLMHDKAGNLQYAEGYKVLVLIENNGGDNIVAALF